MIAIGLTVLMVVGIGIGLWVYNESPFHSLWISLFLFIFPMFFIPSMIASGAGEVYEVSRGELVAIAPNVEKPGAYFFLGSGVAEEKPIFQYIEKSPAGYSEIKTIKVSEAKIFEDSSVAPYVTVESKSMEAWWLAPWPVATMVNEVYFHIPEGSITSNYTVVEQ